MDSEVKYERIHIFGASGAGTTTLAKALCAKLGIEHFDSDDYFWKTKYTEPWPREIRLNMLRNALEAEESWILSGAVIDWGNPLISMFDAVVFLSVPNELRIARLIERERLRYGLEMEPGGTEHDSFNEFIEWANLYEAGGMDVRSRLQQETWLTALSCPVLRIEGPGSVQESVGKALDFLT